MTYLPRDFVITAERLIFAVVDRFVDEPRIPCFLRYRQMPDGRTQKLSTDAANALLRQSYPKYLYQCERRQSALHGVSPDDVVRHLQPRPRVRHLLDAQAINDPFEARAARLVRALAEYGVASNSVGITAAFPAVYGRARP